MTAIYYRSRAAIPAKAQGFPENGTGSLCVERNLTKVVMRGLDPRIHAVPGASGARCEDVDGRIKSGHDKIELRKGPCASCGGGGNAQ